MVRKPDHEHYVNNKDFFKAMKDHRRNVLKAKREKLPSPQVSDYIGDCIMKIANGLSNKGNFINYPFREEMISDGIENCLMYLNNFNPNKSKNPFAYFSQIIYFAFIRRIQKEKKHLYTKYKAIDNAMLLDFYEHSDNDQLNAPQKYISDHSDSYMREFMDNFEKHKDKKKAKSKKKPKVSLDKFFQEEKSD